MSDLISRQAAQAIKVLPKCYRNYQTNNLDDAYENGWEDALFSLNALPTIDPVKHGKWDKDSNMAFYWKCSECGTYLFWRHEEFMVNGEPNYCPNCGAKMDGEE